MHSISSPISHARTNIVQSAPAWAIADMFSPRMAELMTTLSGSELRRLMHRPAIPNKEQFDSLSVEAKLHSLREFNQAYLPFPEEIEFTQSLLATIQQVYRAKRFGENEFNLYFHSCAAAMSGQRLNPLPSCLSAITGTCFSIHGPSQMGRTALIQRILEILGKPFFIEGKAPAPIQMVVVPVIFLQSAPCGTTKGLIRDLREKVLGLLGTLGFPSTSLSDLNGPNSENAAIALCTLLNIGLIVIDGGGFNNINRNTQDMFRFLVKLRQASGIPLLISGSSAYFYSTRFMGNLTCNLFNGPTLHLDAVSPPQQSNSNLSERKKTKWDSICMWFWRQGFLPHHAELPSWLSSLAFQLTQGRLGWLSQGFEQLHMDFIHASEKKKIQLVDSGFVTKSFTKRLMLHSEAIKAISLQRSPQRIDTKTTFLKYIDHFSQRDLNEPNVSYWLDDFLLKRILRA